MITSIIYKRQKTLIYSGWGMSMQTALKWRNDAAKWPEVSYPDLCHNIIEFAWYIWYYPFNEASHLITTTFNTRTDYFYVPVMKWFLQTYSDEV